MKLSRLFRSKWTLAALLLMGLFYFEGHVLGKELEKRSAASELNRGHKLPIDKTIETGER